MAGRQDLAAQTWTRRSSRLPGHQGIRPAATTGGRASATFWQVKFAIPAAAAAAAVRVADFIA
jgi:hypothetical protein